MQEVRACRVRRCPRNPKQAKQTTRAVGGSAGLITKNLRKRGTLDEATDRSVRQNNKNSA
jgi:hypothetical protein